MLILGIESSCDETAAAVVARSTTRRGRRRSRVDVVASQVDIHREWGGVVPELASRQHVRDICGVVERALDDAGVTLGDLGAIAVTRGPGLVGSLLVGLSFAKSFAVSLGLPWSLSTIWQATSSRCSCSTVRSLCRRRARRIGRAHEPLPGSPRPASIALIGRHETTPPAKRTTRWPSCWAWVSRRAHHRRDCAGRERPRLRLPGRADDAPRPERAARARPPRTSASAASRRRCAGTVTGDSAGRLGAQRARRTGRHLRQLPAGGRRGAVSTGRSRRRDWPAAPETSGWPAACRPTAACAPTPRRAARGGLPVFLPSLALSTDNAAMIAAAGLRRFHAGVPRRLRPERGRVAAAARPHACRFVP